jgi:hypothetical protein
MIALQLRAFRRAEEEENVAAHLFCASFTAATPTGATSGALSHSATRVVVDVYARDSA